MDIQLNRPLAFFDLEATGMLTAKDRIVEFAFIKINPDGTKEEWRELVNPEMPIPPDATAIHHITDADVADKPTFKDFAPKLNKFLEGADLGGYNLVRFDVPMLVEEFLRAGVEFDIEKRRIVDAMRLFYLMEPRNLKAAYKFYCGKTLEDAHSALADTQATFEVFLGQLDKYQGQPVIDEKDTEHPPLSWDLDNIHHLSAGRFADLTGQIAFNDKGEEIFNFGKHKGRTVREVFTSEQGYYDWMMKADFPLQTKRVLTRIRLSMRKQ